MYVSIGNWKVKLGKAYYVISSGGKVWGVYGSQREMLKHAAQLKAKGLPVTAWKGVPEVSSVRWTEKKRYMIAWRT